jgi:hypothetical protein
MRHEVKLFADRMEQKLVENDYKGGWADDHWSGPLRRLREEVVELRRACVRLENAEDDPHASPATERERRRIVGREAADVANFAMMIADNAGDLK